MSDIDQRELERLEKEWHNEAKELDYRRELYVDCVMANKDRFRELIIDYAYEVADLLMPIITKTSTNETYELFEDIKKLAERDAEVIIK